MESDVKRIFFKKGIVTPFFEMKDGSIKKPRQLKGYMVWMTDEEYALAASVRSEPVRLTWMQRRIIAFGIWWDKNMRPPKQASQKEKSPVD